MSQLTQLTRFCDLLEEIRNIIWGLAEDHQTERVITVAADNDGRREVWPYVEGLWFTVSVSCGPTLLQVNQESRSELLQRYVHPFSSTVCFPPAPIGSTPAGIIRKTARMSTNDALINPRKDILYLKDSDQVLGNPRARRFLERAFGGNLTEVTAGLRNLAVEHHLKVQSLLNGDKTFFPRFEHVYVPGIGLNDRMEREGCRMVGFSLTAPGISERIDRIMDDVGSPSISLPQFRLFDAQPNFLVQGDGILGEVFFSRRGRTLSREEVFDILYPGLEQSLELRRARGEAESAAAAAAAAAETETEQEVQDPEEALRLLEENLEGLTTSDTIGR